MLLAFCISVYLCFSLLYWLIGVSCVPVFVCVYMLRFIRYLPASVDINQ